MSCAKILQLEGIIIGFNVAGLRIHSKKIQVKTIPPPLKILSFKIPNCCDPNEGL